MSPRRRVSRDRRLAVVGSPEYFAAHPKPNSPHELTSHRCINLRGGSSGPYRWEFEKGGETLVVDVNGPLVLDDARSTGVPVERWTRVSEQLPTRTEEVRTLEGLLHQIEVRIDPALTHNQFWLAVAIGRKNEMSVSAFEKVLTNALRRQ